MSRRKKSRHAKLFKRIRAWPPLLVAIVVAALATSLLALHWLGPPPGLRIDALWVREHEWIVRVFVVALGIAIALSIPGFIANRTRRAIAVAWCVAAALSGLLYWDRFSIVMNVLRNHMF